MQTEALSRLQPTNQSGTCMLESARCNCKLKKDSSGEKEEGEEGGRRGGQEQGEERVVHFPKEKEKEV